MKQIISAVLLAAVFISSCGKEHEEKECPSSTERSYALTGFTKITAEETFTVDIIKGNAFEVKASGCENDLNDLSVQLIAGNFLELKYRVYTRKRYNVKFTITMPEIRSVNLSGVAKGRVTGFNGQAIYARAVLSGAAELLIDGNPEDLQFDVSGAGKLTLKGPVATLKGMVSGAGVLHAFETPSPEIDVAASGTGLAQVNALQAIAADASGASQIIYRGDPTIKDFSTSGTAKISKE